MYTGLSFVCQRLSSSLGVVLVVLFLPVTRPGVGEGDGPPNRRMVVNRLGRLLPRPKSFSSSVGGGARVSFPARIGGASFSGGGGRMVPLRRQIIFFVGGSAVCWISNAVSQIFSDLKLLFLFFSVVAMVELAPQMKD